MELWSSASKEWNSSPLFINTWILTLSFQILEFLYCPCKHLNFGPIFYTWKFWCHRSKHWNSGPIFINIGILALSFDYKHWNSDPIFMHIGILTLSFQTLEFWPFFYKQWNSCPIFTNIAILILFIHCKHWNSRLIHIGFLMVCFKTLEFCPVFLETLEFLSYLLLRKIVLRDFYAWLSRRFARAYSLFILGSCVSVSKAVYFVIFL